MREITITKTIRATSCNDCNNFHQCKVSYDNRQTAAIELKFAPGCPMTEVKEDNNG